MNYFLDTCVGLGYVFCTNPWKDKSKHLFIELPLPVEDGDSQTKKILDISWSFFTAPSSRRFVILYLGCLWLHCGHGGGVCGNADIPSFLCVSFVFR